MLNMDEQLSTMNIENRQSMVEPMEKLEEITLDDNHPERIIRLGTHAANTTRQELVLFFKSSINMFAWSHEDMLGIDPRVMVHRLNISPA